MKAISDKLNPPAKLSDNILKPIPEVDKATSGSLRNITGVVLEASEDGF